MKHDRTSDLREAAAALGVDLDDPTAARLIAFERLLVERAVPLGLVAGSDRGRIRVRHVLDSLRAALAVRPQDAKAYDLGSGAGLPGIVVAIARPALEVWLVEPRRTRAGFLELAVERLGLTNASVLHRRIEDVDDRADLCFARAFAPLAVAWEAALPRLRRGGRLVYFAGPDVRDLTAFPTGARSVEVVGSPVLESAGPLVIMAR